MGAIVSRLRSDPYGATYERHLENIDKECKRLQVGGDGGTAPLAAAVTGAGVTTACCCLLLQVQKFQRRRKSDRITRLFWLVAALLMPLAAIFAGWVSRRARASEERSQPTAQPRLQSVASHRPAAAVAAAAAG